MKTINSFVRSLRATLVMSLVAFSATFAQTTTTYNISTFAGTGQMAGFSEGGAANKAQLNTPGGVAVDANGNVYIADILNHVIRKVEATTGIISTFAGTGEAGYDGDGRAATFAKLDIPGGLDVDANGNVYFADKGCHCVRKVLGTTGIITTIAGDGYSGFSGDGGDATLARLNSPITVAVDANGNVFIADRNNHRIRRVDAATGNISTFAGKNGSGFSGDNGLATNALLSSPVGIDVDSNGDVYIADRKNSRIRKVTVADGIINTVAGNGAIGFSGDGGLATLAALREARHVEVDANGNIYIADMDNQRIRKVDAMGNISTIAGSGSNGAGTGSFSGDKGLATSATLNSPRDMAVDANGNVFIADRGNHRIRKVDAISGIITTFAGTGIQGYSGDDVSATTALLNEPGGIALDSHGDVYIADTRNHRIRKIDVASNTISTVAGTGVDGALGDGYAATYAQLNVPASVAFDSQDNMYIADADNHKIRKVDAVTGIISTVAGDGTIGDSGDGGLATSAQLSRPIGVFVDSNGDFYIADRDNSKIRKVTASDGNITTIAGTGSAGYNNDGILATTAELDRAVGIAVASNGDVYIGDRNNFRVRKIDAVSGNISTIAGDGNNGFSGDGGLAVSAVLGKPRQVTLDGNGDLFFADLDNHSIRRIDADGFIETIAGSGTTTGGYSGDGGAATSAELNEPRDMAVDANGNIYVADRNNHVIRKLTPNVVQRQTQTNIIIAEATSTSMYPNPASQQVTIQNGAAKQVVLMSLQGKVLHQVKTNDGRAELNLAMLKSGVYFIRVLDTNGQLIDSKNLVVNR